MAGVRPQQRGGSNATTIGMVVSIVVSVLLLGVLIWLFTQQEQLRTTADQATRMKDRIARSNEEAAAKLKFPDATAPGKTLVGEMNKGVDLICGRMTGNQTDSPEAAVRKLDALLEEIKGKVPEVDKVSSAHGAVEIIRNLHVMYAGERGRREEREANLEKAQADLAALQASNKELGDNYQAELVKLAAKVAEMQRGKDELDNLKSAEVAALARQIDDKQDVLDTMRRNQSKLLRQLHKEIVYRDRSIDEQSAALAEYRKPGAALAADPLVAARDPIGRVLRALPGDSLVHIDLGKQDKVTLGMTFSVYSSDERVGPDGRGKANIEVMGVGERTAECRITTPPSPDDPILPWDHVGNIVLSRSHGKKTRICVLGRFDIDGDGHADARGAEAIRSLAERYGAEVVGEVDATTDYLVVGQEPEGADEDVAFGASFAEAEDADDEDDEGDEEEDAYDEDYEDDEEEDAYDEDDEDDEEEDAYDEDDEDDEEEDEYDEDDEDDEEEDAYDEDDEDDEEEDAYDEDDEEEDADDEDDEGDEEEDAYDEDDEGDEEEDAYDEDDEEADEDDEYEDDEYEHDEEEAEDEEAVEAPSVPVIGRAVEIDPTVPVRERRAKSSRERYFEAVRRAEMFAVPRLRQDQFFNFIGIEVGPDAVSRLVR